MNNIMATFAAFLCLVSLFAAMSGLQAWASTLPPGLNIAVFSLALAAQAALVVVALTAPINPREGGKTSRED